MAIARRTLIIISGPLLVVLLSAQFSAGSARGQAVRGAPLPTPTATLAAPTQAPSPPMPAGTGTHPVSFSLDAARVSPVNNPGNMLGLASVQPGTPVWLMMYYTIQSVSGVANRVATYTIVHGGKVIFTDSYPGRVGPADTGRSIHYTAYTIPASAPFGQYTFEAVLTIAGRREIKRWGFEVARHTRTATSSAQASPTGKPSFLLYAARVAAVGNPGNMLGLPAAPIGKTVWLMMYYTVARVPRPMSWVATYTVKHAGARVRRFRYRGQFTTGTTGKFIRYVALTLTPSFVPGRYTFQARLSSGGRVQTRSWGFTVTALLLTRREQHA